MDGKFISLFSTVFLVAILPAIALAVGPDRVDVTVYRNGSSPARNVLVEVIPYGESDPIVQGYTDEDGVSRLVGPFNEGSYDLRFSKFDQVQYAPFNLNNEDYIFEGPTSIYPIEVFFQPDPQFSLDLFSLQIRAAGSPASGVNVSLSNGAQINQQCTTDAQGFCGFELFHDGFPAGLYTVSTSLGSPNPVPGGLFVDTSLQVEFSEGTSTFQFGGYEKFEALDLQAASRTLAVSVYEGLTGNPQVPDLSKPLSNITVSTQSYINQNETSSALTDGTGKTFIPLSPTASGLFSVRADSQTTGSAFAEVLVPADGSNAEAVLAVSSTDAYISLSLVDGASGAPIVAETDSNGNSTTYVDCYSEDPSDPSYFSAQVLPGNSSATVTARGGSTYRCSASLSSQFSVQEVEVIALPGQRVGANLRIFQAAEEVTIQFVDFESGLLLPAPNEFEVSCFADPYQTGSIQGLEINHSALGSTNGAQVVLGLVNGVAYSCFASPTFLSGQQFSLLGLGDYAGPGSFEIQTLISPQQEGSPIVQVPVRRVDAQLVICLEDSLGNPVAGTGYAFTPGEDFSLQVTSSGPIESNLNDDLFSDTALDASGCATVGAFSGRDYYVNALPDPTLAVPLLPGEKYVSGLTAGETRTIRIRLKDSNFSLQVAVDPSSSLGGYSLSDSAFDYGFCVAEDGLGASSTTEIFDIPTKSFTLPLFVKKKSPDTLFVSCALFFNNPAGGAGLSFSKNTLYMPPTKKSTDSISLIFDRATPNFPETTLEVRNDAVSRVVLPDGSIATFPIGGISTSGQGSLTFQIPKTALGLSSQLLLLKRFDFSIKTDGVNVTVPNIPPYFCFYLEPEILKLFNGSAENVKLARINEQNRLVITETKIRTRTDGDGSVRQFACGYLDHFSIWAAMLDTAQALKATTISNVRISPPKAVKTSKTKKATANKWKVRFVAPSGSTDVSRFAFEYDSNRKRCRTGEFKKQTAIAGTGPFTVNWKKNALCGRLKTAGGASSKVVFKKKKS
ncbi:MAG: hypothetical protein KDD70_09390 [Bdellovibrionales bacterium]|nr:hypothetical protein [Bdellovibrionales bacterium]